MEAVKARLCDLEGKVEISTGFINKVEVTDEEIGRRVLYVGTAFGLYFEGNDVRGGAKLSKYNISESQRTERKLVRLLPPRWDEKIFKERKESLLWSVQTDNPYMFFIALGETRNGYESGARYRCSLKGSAANRGIGLSPQLFDLVFSPIDKEIMNMYRRAMGTTR